MSRIVISNKNNKTRSSAWASRKTRKVLELTYHTIIASFKTQSQAFQPASGKETSCCSSLHEVDQLAALDPDAVVVDALLAVVAIAVADAASLAKVGLANVSDGAVISHA